MDPVYVSVDVGASVGGVRTLRAVRAESVMPLISVLSLCLSVSQSLCLCLCLSQSHTHTHTHQCLDVLAT